MTTIIEHGSDEPSVIRIGGAEGDEVSLKTYQDMYHQITGKTEEIRKNYKDSFLIEFGDIEQLHIKITQLLDIHNVIGNNFTASIYYEEERKEQYSSFEKFRLFNSNSTSPVSNIVLKYNVSIIPAKLKQPQEYSVTIRLSSRMAQLRELKKNAPPFMQHSFFTMIVSETAEIRVEYADYIIARGFIEAFNEWMDGCNKTIENTQIKWAQRYSVFIPPIGKIMIASLYGYFIYMAVEPIVGETPTLIVFSKYLVLSSLLFFLAISISNMVFRLLERTIDNHTFSSWIKLNKGDEKAISELSVDKKKGFIYFSLSLFGAISVGVIATQISNLIDSLI